MTLFEVLARWGYSEILNGTQAANYTGPVIDALRDRRRQNADFSDLSPAERYTLAFQCGWNRPKLLVYFVGIELFEVTTITKFQLGHLSVPPNVWHPQSNGNFCPFSHYITTPTSEDGDARLVAAPMDGYVRPDDPITLGYINGRYILIDGYHRGASFWRFGPHNDTLPVYKPRLPPGAPQVGAPFLNATPSGATS